MKQAVFVVIALFLGMTLPAQDAESIVRAARNRIQTDTVSTRSRMVITAANGSTTERVIDQYSKDDEQGNERMMIVFQSPASVRGTRFLTIDRTSGDSDRWIFLPSLGKVRRIAASESGSNFMGTDFSYDDMSSMSRDVGSDTHTLLREENLNGAACYVIQSVSNDRNFQYSKMISWIDKGNSVIYQVEMYDRRGTLLKVMESGVLKDVQGHLTPTQTSVRTVNAGTSTTIYMDIVKYDDPIPESVFTTAYLETGRLR
ncbi:MAG: outer membrane lipoprotein-sorting protein [Spirochaetaceae bacterium]|jgi:outer membrane lipoprotein-sorting protein|nr:outer membrane lipoprotein-sorting protein [Spirochaetaceae bacterium]